VLTKIILPLIGGVALFIYGIQITSNGIQKALAQNLKKILEKATSNPVIGVILGFVVTSIIQSSSATTVIVVSLVNSGILTLYQAVGIIFGANIGTTITAQIIALKITKYGFLFLTVGFLLYFLPFRKRVKYFGEFILGFGLIFIAIEIMASAVSPLRNSQKVIDIFKEFGNIPILGVLAGTIFTAIQQSSSVTVGIVQALGMEGLVNINSAFPIVLGANIGTTVTAILASIGTKLSAKRAALSHFLFNLIGTLIFLPIMRPYISFISSLSSDPVKQIANSHTLFNVINTLIFLPFTSKYVSLITKLLPGEERLIETGVKYLNPSILKSPIVAYDSLVNEIKRLANIVNNNFICLKELIFNKNKSAIQDISSREETINFVNREISRYVSKISSLSLPEKEARELPKLLIVSSQLERIGDIIDNTSQIELNRLEERIPYSPYAMKELEVLFELVYRNFLIVKENLFNNNFEFYNEVKQNEIEIDRLEDKMRDNHIERLKEGICLNEAGVVYLDTISNLERIGDHVMKIANIICQSEFVV
jgi:phosphate:Na+ symporter